ncbi:hypothetical protein B0H14DRAFT_2971690 [Mycena olivaceomarginata]|nr:hypothetical protein B0H14DRAFT_2971690 [Mycena olivaceomarginata]
MTIPLACFMHWLYATLHLPVVPRPTPHRFSVLGFCMHAVPVPDLCPAATLTLDTSLGPFTSSRVICPLPPTLCFSILA